MKSFTTCASVANKFLRYCKGIRFIAVLTMLFIVGIGQVWGETETITLSNFGWGNATVQSSITATSATISLAKNNAGTAPTYYTSDGLRIYGVKSATTGGTISFTPKKGITISKIVFTHTSSNSGVLAIKTGVGSYSSKTWSGTLTAGNTVSLVSTNNTNSNPQVRITKIVITYTTAASKHTVTFDAGSGTCSTSSSMESTAGDGVTLPTATICDGWEFAGWKETSAISTETTTAPTLLSEGSIYKPTSNCTLYAVYKRTEESAGGGSTEEKVIFSNQGYTNQQEVSSYEGTNFSVAFNKGSNSNTPKYYTSGTAIRIYGGGYFTVSSDATITKIVLGFGSSDGSNAITTNVDTYSNGTWTGSANSVKFTIGGTSGNRRIASLTVTTSGGGSTTYYHSTPECTTEATVTLDLDGGSFDSKPDGWEEDGNNYTKTVNSGDQVTLPEPNKTGHDFEGWYNASTKVTSPYTLTGNTTLTAHWTPQDYTITYKDQGDAAFSGTHENNHPTQHTYGTATTLKSATKSGYNFLGWFTTSDCSGSAITQLGATAYISNITLYAKWEKAKTATLLTWSVASYVATIDVDNTFPTLTKTPADLSPIAYSSSNTGVATIDANTGDITLVAAGTTTITATFTETATHTGATASYTLTVNPSNCRWVETEIGDIKPEDEVLVTMKLNSGDTYTLDHSKGTTALPPAQIIGINGNEATFSFLYHSNSIWNISVNATDGYILYPNGSTNTWLYCTKSSNNVKVGTTTSNVFTIENGYLKHTNTDWVAYLGVYVNGTTTVWRHHNSPTAQSIVNQTLKFYKKVCLDSENYWVTWDAGEGAWSDGSTKKLESYQVGTPITKPAENPTREGYRFDGWTPAPTTMPAQNTTFTAVWTKVYTITWYENGVPSYTYVPSDNAVVTWEDNIADCGEKKFYGWTADENFVSDPTTPPTLISKGTTIAGDVTYFAVYADAEEPANPGYTKVTTISEGTYLIATDNTANKAYTGRSGTNTYGGSCDVKIENDVISAPESAVEVKVTLNGSNFYMHDGTYYLGYTSGNAMTFDTSIQSENQNVWKLTAEGYIESVNVTGRILQYNSGSPRFACYATNQKKAYLYKKQTTTYANFAVSCATYTITVTAPTDGTVTTTPAEEAGAGQEITINVTPDDCKYLTALKYNDGSDHSINIASTPYTFTMPAADVRVTATFADKNATDIEIITSAHRLLMQGSAFVGEQVRITYNNGDKETLNWNDSRLTFTGHNTATLGSQTVTVTYNGCGTQSASYNIEVIDGLGITFWDGDYTETIKYEPCDLVDVDNKIGQNICSGWEFAGWSETKVANESEEYVPVHNFNATDAKVLYAVYVKKKALWTTIVTADEAKSGAKYVLAYDRYGTYYALTSSVKDVNYLAGKVVTSTEGELNSFDVYYLSEEPTADLIWELSSADENGKWYLYNKKTAKYIDFSTQGQIHLTDLPSDKLQMESGYNDSQIRISSSTVPTYYLSWDNSNTRYNTYASSNSQEYWYTKDEEFTSTPPCSPLSATFHGNGGTVIAAGGSPTDDDLTITEPTRDAGITTPTAAFADCNGKSWTFVGWSDKEVDVTRVPVLTTDLLHDGGGYKPYKIQEDGEEFWAVYTNQGNPETIYGTITFTQEDWGTNYSTGTKTKTVGGIDYSFSYERLCKATTQGIQFEENNGKFANATSLGKINSIRFGKFNRGDIDDLKVYVGKTADNVTTALTAADLQVVENTYTYYPSADYAFFKVVSVGEVCYVEEITIDYGQPTKVWATTPDCSIIRILTDEEVYVTATKDRGIMATAPLTIKTQQLDANADVVITSTSSYVYFSATRDANFAKAAANQPKTSLTLNADADGNLQQEIYVHYKPSTEGNGTPASVVVSANLATPNPSITDDQTIYVRNLPAQFVIATKVGANWYALPANMSEATNPEGVLIEVDEASMTATAPNTASYTLFPVKTTNGEYDRYATNTTHYEGNAYGDRVRFAAVNNNKGLWANNSENGNTIRNNAAISSVSDGGTTSNTNPSYEWIITTSVVDGNWQYTLQTDQDKNQQYLRYWVGATGAPKWGTYAAGNNQLYFLPVTETEPFDYKVVEWYPTKMLIQTDATIANPTAEIGDAPINNVTCTNKGSKLYEIAGLPLESNPTKVLTIKFSDGGNNYTNATAIPVIISQSATTVSNAPFTTLTKDVYNYADLVVRDGATLTIDGGTHAENTFFNVIIYPTSKISVPSDKKLTVHSLTFFGGIDEIYNGSTYTLNRYGVPELSLKGTLYKSIAKMDYVMRVDLDQMYSLTVPYDVQLADIKYWDGSNIELGTALYVSAYDGEARANQSKKTWIYETDFESRLGAATLKAGVGYTISAELQSGVRSKYSILRMPMNSNIANDATEAAKTVAVTAWGKDANVTDNHKGWNLVGNPYMTTIQGADDADLVLGYLKETGTGPWEWVEKTYRYVTIPSDDGTYYWQQKFTDAVLPPFKNFFVQVGTTGELVFDLGTRQSMPARSTQAAIEKEVEFEILMSNDARQDNTGLLISEEYSPAYEINADLEKMTGSMSVYTIYGGYKLAYNALSPINASEWIPMGYIAPTAGEYTFRIDDVDKVIDQVAHIYLIDYTTNTVTDLMVDEYQFATLVGTNDTRFAINVILNSRDNTATGLGNIKGDDDQPIKFIYQDKMYIHNNGIIYNATGKQVTTINK